MPSPVLVLGGTGMIGNAILEVFSERGIAVRATTRDVGLLPPERQDSFVRFDVIRDDLAELLAGYGEGDFVINCTGVIKQQIDDGNEAHRLNALRLNSLFPYELARLAEANGFRVIHVATDCVYSGRDGGYDESSLHDCTDVYGKSKSLGEVPSHSVVNLRCSMIGVELKGKASLLEWVLNHPDGSEFSGYTDHVWNGITARAFGAVAAGIISTGNPISGTQHVVPADSVTKHELSQLIVDAYGMNVSVVPTATGHGVDRTLTTTDRAANARLWSDAGFEAAPRIADLVADLAHARSARNLG